MREIGLETNRKTSTKVKYLQIKQRLLMALVPNPQQQRLLSSKTEAGVER